MKIKEKSWNCKGSGFFCMFDSKTIPHTNVIIALSKEKKKFKNFSKKLYFFKTCCTPRSSIYQRGGKETLVFTGNPGC